MIKVLQSGFYTTVQDLGRNGFQHIGVPHSGVMDAYSAGLANQILGNPDQAAVLEITMTGPKLQFDQKTTICITGADLSAQLNSKIIKQNTAISISEGDELSFGKLNYGFRAYIAVIDGFKTEMILNSRSMYTNITSHNVITKDDLIAISDQTVTKKSGNATIKVNGMHFNSESIEVYPGPEFNALSQKQKEQLFSTKFFISKLNNRMAYQLEEKLPNNLNQIITSMVLPGTVQLTPSGQIIILMRDCQTTGGYPRILQLSEASINVLAQKYTGKQIKFNEID